MNTGANTTCTFTAASPIFLDGAVIVQATHQITATGYRETLTFTLDGQPATFQPVADVRALAESRGQWVRVSGPSLMGIGNAVAYRLHLQLAGRGYVRGYSIAAEILGREVTSLAALSREDAQEVLSYACGSVGVATYGLVAA